MTAKLRIAAARSWKLRLASKATRSKRDANAFAARTTGETHYGQAQHKSFFPINACH